MKNLLLAGLVISSLALNAQSIQKQKQQKFSKLQTANKSLTMPPSNMYSFSTFTSTYQNITGSVVSGGLKWDDLEYTIPIGFNFKLYNSAPSNTITFFGGELATFNDINNDPYITAAFPMFEDLCDRAYDPNVDSEGDPGGISVISYTTVGSPGSQICKIEVNNAGFYGENDANATSVSSVNFQLWLYETSNDIEFHYGSMNIQNASTNLQNAGGWVCGLLDSLDVNASTYTATSSNMLNGAHNSPSMVVLDPNLADYITGNIQSGRVYRFAKSIPTTVKSISGSNKSISLYPNPAHDILYINKPNDFTTGTVELYDVSGKVVLSEAVGKDIKLSSLSNGFYVVKIKSEDSKEVFTGKVVVAH